MDDNQVYEPPKWYPLDVAGTIYPSSRTRHWNSNYRMSFLMKEDVDPDRLRAALVDMHKRFPSFFAGVRRGLFWYYLERMDNLDIVFPETEYPCRSINICSKTTPALRILYDRKRLSLEISHCLADGGASIMFMKALLARYLQLGGAEIEPGSDIPDVEEPLESGEFADAYRENYTKHAPKAAAESKAWQYRPPVVPNYFKVIHATVPVGELLALAKKRGMSLTDYLTGAYLYAFYQADPTARRSRKPIKIQVPVSLRNLYPTKTLRNFSLFANVGFYPRSKENFSFEDILEAIKGKLEAAKTKDEMHKLLCQNVSLIRNPFIRIAPNVLKRQVLRIAFILGELNQTSILSNLGRMSLPPSVAAHVDTFEVLLGGSPQMKLTLGVVSDDKYVHFYFTGRTPKTDVQREMFRLLTKEGLRMRVESNIGEGEDAV